MVGSWEEVKMQQVEGLVPRVWYSGQDKLGTLEEVFMSAVARNHQQHWLLLDLSSIIPYARK